jgi:hypothetical protein
MTGTDIELLKPEQIADVLLDQSDVTVVDAIDIQVDIVRRILAAGTVEEAHAETKTTPARELEGLLVTVHGVAWAKSAYEGGAAVYALLDVTADGADEHLTVSMGGRTVMASFLWDQQHQAFPVQGTFRLEQSQTNPENKFWTFILHR